MKRLAPYVILPVALLLAACSGDPGSSATPSAIGASTVGAVAGDCAAAASDSAQAHGDRVFVEAGGTQYTVVATRALPGDRVIVETTVDQPDLVGYGEVWFLSQCAGDDVVLLGGYVPIDGEFQLLFTTDEGSAADVSMTAP